MSPIILGHKQEDWETRFGYAQLKIERADEHIRDFEGRIAKAGNTYRVTQILNPKSGQKALHYESTDTTVRYDLALILGDGLHNLRSALDIAWIAILEERFPHAVNARNQFTIFNDLTHLEGTLKSRKINPGMPLFEYMVGYLKPHRNGGNAELLALHDLDINDKHFALIPTLNIANIRGVKFKNAATGVMAMSSIMGFGSFLSHTCDIQVGFTAEDYGHVVLGVQFGHDTPLENSQVVPYLHRIRQVVFEIVSTFRGL
jgi:hypothetical protein